MQQEPSANMAPDPPAHSQLLKLLHPDPTENHNLWASTAAEWKGGLSVEQYIEHEVYLASMCSPSADGFPLKHADWILVDSTLGVAKRRILSSCETFQKRALKCRDGGAVEDVVVYGIASVFTAHEFRRKGYARRMLLELAKFYREKCEATILYSDIGRKYYAGLGWVPLPSNSHLMFLAKGGEWMGRKLFAADLEKLCAADEEMIRRRLGDMEEGGETRMVVLPDHRHMLWHHIREEFACKKLLGRAPEVKGALAGKPGSRVWVVWTHKYDGRPGFEAENTLFILRLVIEKTSPEGKEREEVRENLRRVLSSARAEAEESELRSVKVWDPTLLTRELVKEMGMEVEAVEREDDGMASVMINEGHLENVNWVANERYAWC